MICCRPVFVSAIPAATRGSLRFLRGVPRARMDNECGAESETNKSREPSRQTEAFDSVQIDRPAQKSKKKKLLSATKFDDFIPPAVSLTTPNTSTPKDEPLHSRAIRVAVLGAPNAGKSVIVNRLIGSDVCAVSNKVHTTRKLTRAICVKEGTQIVLSDTPGLVGRREQKKHGLESRLVLDPEKSLASCNVILVVVDVANIYTRNFLDRRLLFLLHRYRTRRSILILNKVDIVKPKGVLLDLAYTLCNGVMGGVPMKQLNRGSSGDGKREQDVINELAQRYSKSNYMTRRFGVQPLFDPELEMATRKRLQVEDLVRRPLHEVDESTLRRVLIDQVGWSHFDKIFMLSATRGDGIAEIRDYLLRESAESHWDYHSSVRTNQTPQEIVLDCIRGCALDHLANDVPYRLQFRLDQWETDEHGTLFVTVTLIPAVRAHIAFVIGVEGSVVRAIQMDAVLRIRNIFQSDVFLHLDVHTFGKKQGRPRSEGGVTPRRPMKSRSAA